VRARLRVYVRVRGGISQKRRDKRDKRDKCCAARDLSVPAGVPVVPVSGSVLEEGERDAESAAFATHALEANVTGLLGPWKAA
jgi:hypothetical protein